MAPAKRRKPAAGRAKEAERRRPETAARRPLRHVKQVKQVLLVHSAGSQGPREGSGHLHAHLQEALGKAYRVLYPKMPSPENPDYPPWKGRLEKLFAGLDDGVIVVGHSLGGSVLLKYLSEGGSHPRIAGLFLAATPFWGAPHWEYEGFVLARGFAGRLPVTPVFLYHSRDDDVVPFSHLARYARRLPGAELRRPRGSGHLFRDGVPGLAEDISGLGRR